MFKDLQDHELLVDVRAESVWAELWIFLNLLGIIQSFVGTSHRKIEAMGNGMPLLLRAAARYETSVEVSAGLEAPQGTKGFHRSAARKNRVWIQR